MAPKSVGHYYRVVNHAEALVALGFDVNITSPDQVVPILESGKKISVLIFFRGSYNELFCYCRNWADKNAVPILLDLDDLTFDVKCFEPGQWSFWASLPAAEQEIWRNRVHSQFRALQAADGALVSTLPLAQHVRSMQRLAWVWPNGFGETSWRSFQAARCIGPLQRQRAMCDVITIGYASGTPTHSADFETVAVALGGLMRRERSIQLCLIGFLDLASYPALRGLESRITHRPLVAYDQLALEYARFDINLAPLEIHSSFCQAKSALKFFESAAVGVPTVATPTQPFKELIRTVGTDAWHPLAMTGRGKSLGCFVVVVVFVLLMQPFLRCGCVVPHGLSVVTFEGFCVRVQVVKLSSCLSPAVTAQALP